MHGLDTYEREKRAVAIAMGESKVVTAVGILTAAAWTPNVQFSTLSQRSLIRSVQLSSSVLKLKTMLADQFRALRILSCWIRRQLTRTIT